MALTFLIVIIFVNLIKGKTSVSPHAPPPPPPPPPPPRKLGYWSIRFTSYIELTSLCRVDSSTLTIWNSSFPT